MRLILLFAFMIFQFFLPQHSLVHVVKTSKAPLASASLEDVEYIWTGEVFTINDFVINEENFKDGGFHLEYSVTFNEAVTTNYYKFEVEVVNGSGTIINSETYSSLVGTTSLPLENEGVYNFSFVLSKSLMHGELAFTFNIYYSSSSNFASNVYNFKSFSFKIHSYYDEAVEFNDSEIKLFYEVEFKQSYLITRYETLTILGAESVLEYPYYGTIRLDEFSFVYSLGSSNRFAGSIYYFVLDEKNVLSSITDYELTLDEIYKGVELSMEESSTFTFGVLTDDFYLDTNTYKLNKTRTSVYKTKVNSIYYPKDNYGDFCYTSHIFYLSNFGVKGRNIYFKFFIDMELNYLENGFYVEGGYGKLIDDYYQEEVIL